MVLRGTSLAIVGVVGVLLNATALAAPPSRVNLSYSHLRHGWIAGIPHDVRHESRIVGMIGAHRVAVAPTRNGNFCEAFSGAFAGCRVRSAGVIGPTVMGKGRDISAIAGNVLTVSRSAALYVQFGSAAPRVVPMMWVSRPIEAGFYFINAPARHQTAILTLREGHRVIAASGVLRIYRVSR